MCFKRIKRTLSFLTRLPVGIDFDSFDEVAKEMHYFPIAAFIIGFLASFATWVIGGGPLLYLPNPPNYQVPSLLLGMIVLGLILLITGLHHTDGLMDLGDGLMVHGSKEKKIEVMHDVNVGVGGNILTIIVYAITGISFGYFNFNLLISLVIVTEISAKLSMVTAAAFGRSARKEGLGATFIRFATKKMFIKAFFLAILFSIFGFMIQGIINLSFFDMLNQLVMIIIIWLSGFIIGILTSVLFIRLANRNFGGLTGDVFGAMNEITRMVTAIVIVIILHSINSELLAF